MIPVRGSNFSETKSKQTQKYLSAIHFAPPRSILQITLAVIEFLEIFQYLYKTYLLSAFLAMIPARDAHLTERNSNKYEITCRLCIARSRSLLQLTVAAIELFKVVRSTSLGTSDLPFYKMLTPTIIEWFNVLL